MGSRDRAKQRKRESREVDAWHDHLERGKKGMGREESTRGQEPRETERQTERQRNRERQRQTERDRETERRV